MLEVLIAITILAIISVSVYQATTNSFKLRESLSQEADFYNSIRMAMQILARDFSLLYSPVAMLPGKDFQAAPQGAAKVTLDQLQGTELGRPTDFWNPVVDASGVRPSRFQGKESKVSFVSSGHVRVYRDAPESELVKVTYETKPDKSELAPPGTVVLIKSESPNAFGTDDDRDEARSSFPLLRGIKALRFEYYQRGKEAPLKSWDNEGQDLKNLYPQIVALSIEVVGAGNLKFEGTYKFKPELPIDGLNPSF